MNRCAKSESQPEAAQVLGQSRARGSRATGLVLSNGETERLADTQAVALLIHGPLGVGSRRASSSGELAATKEVAHRAKRLANAIHAGMHVESLLVASRGLLIQPDLSIGVAQTR